jgi:hypothetical protein
MTTKATLLLAIAAGFLGGVISQRLVPTPVRAQNDAPVPPEIRAHKFVLVDPAGVDRGVFAFNNHGDPRIELMDADGRTWGVRFGRIYRNGMLPDATCASCQPNKGSK